MRRFYFNPAQYAPGEVPGAIAPYTLQRLDLHRTELHDAGAVLQPDAAARVLAVLDAVDGLLAVERHGELRALGDDLIGVPLVRRLGHRHHFGDVDDRAGAVPRVRPLVENIHLVAVFRRQLRRVGAADEDAAVGFGIDPELRLDLEVGEGVLRHQEAVAAEGVNLAVDQHPVGIADLAP